MFIESNFELKYIIGNKEFWSEEINNNNDEKYTELLIICQKKIIYKK